ncbi:hypothetical protein V6N12_047148 [Hibiscus sabdariffa]|uniref:Uncharacterized protein n=1 Tax=Hibiscus sabdariffa TaxID=183260 RepID=A0ABR2DA08_9ROSI
MGDYTDSSLVGFLGPGVVVGSQRCESRSRSAIGRRLVRLGRPPLGFRHPCRLLCQVWDDVCSAGGTFQCGKGSCFWFFVLQDPVRVLIFVDWYGVLDDEDQVIGCSWLGFVKRGWFRVRNRVDVVKIRRRIGISEDGWQLVDDKFGNWFKGVEVWKAVVWWQLGPGDGEGPIVLEVAGIEDNGIGAKNRGCLEIIGERWCGSGDRRFAFWMWPSEMTVCFVWKKKRWRWESDWNWVLAILDWWYVRWCNGQTGKRATVNVVAECMAKRWDGKDTWQQGNGICMECVNPVCTWVF